MIGDFLLLTDTPLNLGFFDFELAVLPELIDESELVTFFSLFFFNFFFVSFEDDSLDEEKMRFLFLVSFCPFDPSLFTFDKHFDENFFFGLFDFTVLIVEDPPEELDVRFFFGLLSLLELVEELDSEIRFIFFFLDFTTSNIDDDPLDEVEVRFFCLAVFLVSFADLVTLLDFEELDVRFFFDLLSLLE